MSWLIFFIPDSNIFLVNKPLHFFTTLQRKLCIVLLPSLRFPRIRKVIAVHPNLRLALLASGVYACVPAGNVIKLRKRQLRRSDILVEGENKIRVVSLVEAALQFNRIKNVVPMALYEPFKCYSTKMPPLQGLIEWHCLAGFSQVCSCREQTSSAKPRWYETGKGMKRCISDCTLWASDGRACCAVLLS